jgi:hypothetical protein
MSHYYRDTDYSKSLYEQSYKYQAVNGMKNFWGYQPNKYDSSGSERYINSVTIYSLYQKQFSEYRLVNPMITGFQHGQHTQGQSDFLENTMTLAYETVLYAYGTVKIDEAPNNFAVLNYDTTASPLTPQGGGTNSILGPGGLLNAVTGISQNLSQQYDSAGNPIATPISSYAASGLAAYRSYSKLNGQNLLGMAGSELQNIASGILSGDSNTINRLAIPTAKPTPGSLGVEQAIQE